MSKSFKRRPKGSGTTYKLSGNRRRPYVAAITLGTDEETGRQIQKPIGYFESEQDALNALTLYHMNLGDYKISSNRITINEIWEIIQAKELVTATRSTINAYNVAYKNLNTIHNRNISDLSLFDIQPIFDKMSEEGSRRSKMNTTKVVLSKIYDYAMRYEYVQKDYSKLVKIIVFKKSESKVPFTDEQIKWLFNHDEDVIVQSILIMIYTGMRPSEFLNIKKDNIFLESRYMIGGMKTAAGTNRIIPIHESMVNYITSLQNNPTEFLFAPTKKLLNITSYTRYFFNKIKEPNEWVVTPHSARHTFISLANRYDLKDINIKRIVGHSNKDLTKDVYTHIDSETLVQEVNKIPIIC